MNHVENSEDPCYKKRAELPCKGHEKKLGVQDFNHVIVDESAWKSRLNNLVVLV